MLKNHSFKKSLGQNFIKDISVSQKVVSLLGVRKEDNVLEIGGGDGRFSELIARQCKSLNIVEIDDELAEYLKQKFEEMNVKIFNEDFLSFELERMIKPYIAFGALPFNISKKIISKIIESPDHPTRAVFIIQDEVASNFCAKAPRATFFSNYLSIFAKCEYLMKISASSFHPMPKVNSGVISLKLKKHIEYKKARELSKFIKNAFRSPRKTLANNLSSIYPAIDSKKIIADLNFSPTVRPSELELSDFEKIFELTFAHG